MDALTIVIMLILFVIAMIFVFSTALLTPYMGKKNIFSVIGLGLIVGLVGGAFLLSPIADDIPDFSRTIIEGTVDGTDTVEMNLSTNGNLTQIISNISSINGVQSIDYDGIIFTTNEFESDLYKSTFMERLNNSNENISNVEDLGNNTYNVIVKEGGDPQGVLNSIYSTFRIENYAVLRFTAMPATATVDASNVTNIMEAISDSGAVVTNVSGPTEDAIAFINNNVPDSNVVIVIGGAIGVIVALIGHFVDSLYSFTKKSHKRKKKESSRDRIKRKTIPDSGINRRSFNKDVKKSDSIDIFNESFDSSPKQNIGSNKNFKQLDEDDLKTSGNDGDKSGKSRFDSLLSRASKVRKSGNKDGPDESGSKQHKKRSVKVRPKRRE